MRRRHGEAAMGSRVSAKVAEGMLAAVAVGLLLLMLAFPGGSSAVAQAAANDQSAVTLVTITGCDSKQVTVKLREYQVFKEHNRYRISKGLPTFCVDADLQAVAQGHSTDMAARNFYDHVTPSGVGPGKRLGDAGYSCYSFGSENIGAYLPEDTSAEVMQSWIDSGGHRANVERSSSVRIGIGSANDADFGEWNFNNADFGEYINYTVNFAGNDCDDDYTSTTPVDDTPPEDDTPPGEEETPPVDDTTPGDEATPNQSAPVIANMLPSAGSRVRDTTPRFSAAVRDTQTSLAKSNISVYIDGRRFSNFNYSVSTDKLSGVSRKLKADKRHTVRVVADDGEGKTSSKTTRFTVR